MNQEEEVVKPDPLASELHTVFQDDEKLPLLEVHKEIQENSRNEISQAYNVTETSDCGTSETKRDVSDVENLSTERLENTLENLFGIRAEQEENDKKVNLQVQMPAICQNITDLSDKHNETLVLVENRVENAATNVEGSYNEKCERDRNVKRDVDVDILPSMDLEIIGDSDLQRKLSDGKELVSSPVADHVLKTEPENTKKTLNEVRLKNQMSIEQEDNVGDLEDGKLPQNEVDDMIVMKVDTPVISSDNNGSSSRSNCDLKTECDPEKVISQTNVLVTNKEVEEDVIAQLQEGVEVTSPKGGDLAKDNRQYSETNRMMEDVTKDPQRPRSRAYPFKVLVSGLPVGARREDVLYYFSQFGEVLKLWDEGRHRANVLFSDEESFKKAIFARDPYFDDHKLLIRSLNECIAVISGIPRSIPVKDAEKMLKTLLEEAGARPCRITLPLSDPTNAGEHNLLQGHAYVAFPDPQTLQKAENRHTEEPFMIDGHALTLHQTINQFYDQFCIRVHPLSSDLQRSVVFHNVQATFAPIGEIIAISCQYIGNSNSYAVYVLFESEESVTKARALDEVNILGQFVEVQRFHPFDKGQGFRHIWLKVVNLPTRVTITEIKHHFGHDRGILNVELDLDFGSCFMQVDSEAAIQRCFRMHQTYLRGKCIAVLIADEHPDRSCYREVVRRGRNRPNYRNNSGRKKALAGNNNNSNNNNNPGFSGKTFTSATQPQGTQDRRGYERGDRKFSKSRSNASHHSKESSKAVKDDGDGVKIAEAHAV